ncbi:unnamed protein product [Rhizophagus irregularis]|nr:unnamed protein product [Rhizophagus irregularis]
MIRDLDARDNQDYSSQYQPDLWYESHEDMNNWDNPSSAPLPEQQSSLPNVLMHLSPNTSFSYDENSTILPFRHVPLDSLSGLSPPVTAALANNNITPFFPAV